MVVSAARKMGLNSWIRRFCLFIALLLILNIGTSSPSGLKAQQLAQPAVTAARTKPSSPQRPGLIRQFFGGNSTSTEETGASPKVSPTESRPTLAVGSLVPNRRRLSAEAIPEALPEPASVAKPTLPILEDDRLVASEIPMEMPEKTPVLQPRGEKLREEMFQEVVSASNLDAREVSSGKELLEMEEDTQRSAVNLPMIKINGNAPRRLTVGQEATYTLTVSNSRQGAAAEELVITTAVPNGIEITSIQPTVGMSRVSEYPGDHTQTACIWRLGTLQGGQSETLVLKFIPRVRNNIDLVSDYEYKKADVRSSIEVQEPILELSIDGRNTIDWGVEDKYRLQIRNTGNGEARNIRLNVATGERDNASRTLDVLYPGEEKTIEINIKTVLDDLLNINVNALADYGFSASTRKTIEILRGHLDLFVEVPEVQFVNDEVNYIVHVSNTGQSNLQDVEVAAAIPPAVEYLSCTGDGRIDEFNNRLVWNIPMLKPEEEQVYQVTGKLLRAGLSRMEITAADPTGVTAVSDASVQVEAIAALNININKPTGPVATGSEIDYEVVISNNGTKAAEEVESGFFLPEGMTPLSVDGGGMISESEGKVLFNKITFLGPGQSVAYKVRVKADCNGNQKVQAILESPSEDVALVAEEMNYFYQRRTIARHTPSTKEQVALRPEAERGNSSRPQMLNNAAPSAPQFPNTDNFPLPANLPENPLPGPVML